MQLLVINRSHHPLPQYATSLSAGLDLRANLDAPVTLQPLERRLIPTGLYLALPAGYEAQVRPRSGLALKKGITVLNTPGTIDSGYRGEVGVILANFGESDFAVRKGDKIAQLVIAPVTQAEVVETDTVDETDRGEGGFGSTGL